jgi:hypothetical protein
MFERPLELTEACPDGSVATEATDATDEPYIESGDDLGPQGQERPPVATLPPGEYDWRPPATPEDPEAGAPPAGDEAPNESTPETGAGGAGDGSGDDSPPPPSETPDEGDERREAAARVRRGIDFTMRAWSEEFKAELISEAEQQYRQLQEAASAETETSSDTADSDAAEQPAPPDSNEEADTEAPSSPLLLPPGPPDREAERVEDLIQHTLLNVWETALGPEFTETGCDRAYARVVRDLFMRAGYDTMAGPAAPDAPTVDETGTDARVTPTLRDTWERFLVTVDPAEVIESIVRRATPASDTDRNWEIIPSFPDPPSDESDLIMDPESLAITLALIKIEETNEEYALALWREGPASERAIELLTKIEELEEAYFQKLEERTRNQRHNTDTPE